MSDSAFKSAPFASYTTTHLRERLAGNGHPQAPELSPETAAKMQAEIVRREKVAAGDTSVMTDGERLRHAQKAVR